MAFSPISQSTLEEEEDLVVLDAGITELLHFNGPAVSTSKEQIVNLFITLRESENEFDLPREILEGLLSLVPLPGVETEPNELAYLLYDPTVFKDLYLQRARLRQDAYIADTTIITWVDILFTRKVWALFGCSNKEAVDADTSGGETSESWEMVQKEADSQEKIESLMTEVSQLPNTLPRMFAMLSSIATPPGQRSTALRLCFAYFVYGSAQLLHHNPGIPSTLTYFDTLQLLETSVESACKTVMPIIVQKSDTTSVALGSGNFNDEDIGLLFALWALVNSPNPKEAFESRPHTTQRILAIGSAVFAKEDFRLKDLIYLSFSSIAGWCWRAGRNEQWVLEVTTRWLDLLPLVAPPSLNYLEMVGMYSTVRYLPSPIAWTLKEYPETGSRILSAMLNSQSKGVPEALIATLAHVRCGFSEICSYFGKTIGAFGVLDLHNLVFLMSVLPKGGVAEGWKGEVHFITEQLLQGIEDQLNTASDADNSSHYQTRLRIVALLQLMTILARSGLDEEIPSSLPPSITYLLFTLPPFNLSRTATPMHALLESILTFLAVLPADPKEFQNSNRVVEEVGNLLSTGEGGLELLVAWSQYTITHTLRQPHEISTIHLLNYIESLLSHLCVSINDPTALLGRITSPVIATALEALVTRWIPQNNLEIVLTNPWLMYVCVTEQEVGVDSDSGTEDCKAVFWTKASLARFMKDVTRSLSLNIGNPSKESKRLSYPSSPQTCSVLVYGSADVSRLSARKNSDECWLLLDLNVQVQ